MDATYRNDLRELNEVNFQRFDAKLEQRVFASEARLDRRITELKADTQVGFANLQRDLERGLRAQLKWMVGFWLGTVIPLAGLIVVLNRWGG